MEKRHHNDDPMVTHHRKIVAVGDGNCGKTCLLMTFARGEMPREYVPTVFDNYVSGIEVDKRFYELSLWDTAGQDAYDRLRPLSYPDTDVMLVCVSVDQPDSLLNALDKWIPEVRHFCPNIPIVIVCTKIDLRSDQRIIARLARCRQVPISVEQGLGLAESVKAAAYIECSAQTRQGVREVFQAAVRATMISKKSRRKQWRQMMKAKCTFL